MAHLLSYSQFICPQTKWRFWRVGNYFQPIRILKALQIALIDWIKVGLPNRPLLLWTSKQANKVQGPVTVKTFPFFFESHISLNFTFSASSKT